MSPVGQTWGCPQYEQDFIDGQVCRFVCGVEGCEYGSTTVTLSKWLEMRTAHWRTAHPNFRPPKRKRITRKHKYALRDAA